MKNYFSRFKASITVLTIILLLISTNVILNASGDHGRSIKDVLKEIRKELNLDEKTRIDPNKVPDQLLEELGEAVMSEQYPNERTHERMDNMMGGEGSESLKSAHRSIGYNYLSGNRRGFWGGMPMMRGGRL